MTLQIILGVSGIVLAGLLGVFFLLWKLFIKELFNRLINPVDLSTVEGTLKIVSENLAELSKRVLYVSNLTSEIKGELKGVVARVGRLEAKELQLNGKFTEVNRKFDVLERRT